MKATFYSCSLHVCIHGRSYEHIPIECKGSFESFQNQDNRECHQSTGMFRSKPHLWYLIKRNIGHMCDICMTHNFLFSFENIKIVFLIFLYYHAIYVWRPRRFFLHSGIKLLPWFHFKSRESENDLVFYYSDSCRRVWPDISAKSMTCFHKQKDPPPPVNFVSCLFYFIQPVSRLPIRKGHYGAPIQHFFIHSDMSLFKNCLTPAFSTMVSAWICIYKLLVSKWHFILVILWMCVSLKSDGQLKVGHWLVKKRVPLIFLYLALAKMRRHFPEPLMNEQQHWSTCHLRRGIK